MPHEVNTTYSLKSTLFQQISVELHELWPFYAIIIDYSSDELSKSLHSATDKLGIEDFRAEQIDALKAFLRGQVVRGT